MLTSVLSALAATLLALGLFQDASTVTPRFRYILADDYRGWVCADFGVEGAPALKQEDGLYVIEPAGSAILRTSSFPSLAIPPFASELFHLVNGSRRKAEIREIQRRSASESNNPVSRHCLFFGSSAAAAAVQRPPTLTESRLETDPVLQHFEFMLGDLCEFRDQPRLCVAPTGISARLVRDNIMRAVGKGTSVVTGPCESFDGIVVQYDADRTVGTHSSSRGAPFAHAQLSRNVPRKGTTALTAWMSRDGGSSGAIAGQFAADLADFLRHAASARCSR